MKIEMSKQETLIQGMLDAFYADARNSRPYRPMYEALHAAYKDGATLSQAYIRKLLEIPQTIISQMLKRMITCGIVRVLPARVNGLNQYTVVTEDMLDCDRVAMASELFAMQARTQALRDTFAQRYDVLS